MKKLEVTGRQICAARALLGLHQQHIAESLRCTRAAISMIERGRRLPAEAHVVAFLERRGVEFIKGGVRLR